MCGVHYTSGFMLGPPDTHYLSGAAGWLGLGNLVEAQAELEQLSLEAREHPDALELQWLIYANQGQWEAGLAIARKLLHGAPDRPTGWLHRSYAMRRVPGGSIQEAMEALEPAFEKFPSESIIPYNLACYACQLGQMEIARVWLRRAVASGGAQSIKAMALADTDLEPLWEEIRRLH